MAKKKIPDKYQVWINARKRFRLSDAQVQMARELGMNPKNFGGLDNHEQEPWKIPLPEFIESLYFKRFGKRRPDQVRSIEQVVSDLENKEAVRRAAKQSKRTDAEAEKGDMGKSSIADARTRVTHIETNLDRIKALSLEREDENWEFRAFLKRECPPDLDFLAHELYREIAAAIDCTTCGNCCREMGIVLTRDDIERFARGFGLPLEEFTGKYIIKTDEGLTFRETPCPFLQENRCVNYDARPEDCRSFPHLHKDGIVGRLFGVVANYDVCPIVFNVYERLKEELWMSMPSRY